MADLCEHRFKMAKALAAAFASKSNVPSSNIDARAHYVVLLANALVNKLEELQAGVLTEKPIVDNYEDAE